MSQKKYIGLNTLKIFLDNLKATFASLSHTHSYDELRNKPFYEGQDYSSILTNGVSTINFYDWGGNVYGAAVTDAPKTFTQDVSHKVIWDNVEYTMTCIYGGDNEAGNPITSLGAPYGDYSVYPFGIDSYKTADGLVEYSIHTKSTSSTHTIDVLELGTSYVTLDEKFIPQSIYTEFDTIKDAKADWNQNDETKIDYIKNRTHWTAGEAVAIVDETVNCSNGRNSLNNSADIELGKEYIIVFNGVTYNCICFDDGGYKTIGAPYGNYENYPFNIYNNYGMLQIVVETSGSYPIKISTINETVHKLDEKYIPDTIAKNDDLKAVKDTLSNKVNKKVDIGDMSDGFKIKVISAMDTSDWDGVVYGDGKYVAVGDTNFAYSTDGLDWQYGTLPASASGIAYGNGMYCTYGYSGKTVCYSNDGINWNTADTNYNSNKFSIRFLNGKFFISAGYAILSSSDCINWASHVFDNYTSSYTLYGGAYGNGVYVMSGKAVLTSTNGTTWTKVTMPTNHYYNSVHFVNGKFIAFAHWDSSYNATNAVAYSSDGKNWTAGTLPISTKWVESAYCNGMLMIAGQQNIIYSNDGVNWEIGSLPEGWQTIDCMGSGNEILLINGNAVGVTTSNPYDLVFKSDIENINKWKLIYDSGEISDIVNSVSGINISDYTDLRVSVLCYNDGDSLGSRAGSVIFTSQNGKTYQFPVWTDMFSKSVSTVFTMAQFKITDGWLICPCASKYTGDTNMFDFEGGTADNAIVTGSGMMRCTNSLSTLAVSNLDQNSKYYFGVGSRVIVWGCKA